MGKAKVLSKTKKTKPGQRRRRELNHVHELLDRLGAPKGSAVERLVGWIQHKKARVQSNGHPGGCQCQTCCEGGIASRFLAELQMRLIELKVTETSSYDPDIK